LQESFRIKFEYGADSAMQAVVRFWLGHTVNIGVIIGIAGILSANPLHAAAPVELCKSAVKQAERENRMPNMLLHAVSLAESGRWHRKERASIAWPWTVTAKGKGTFYRDRNTAIRAVKKLQKEGINNIDVGCMQINLRHHKSAFKSLEDAFSPAVNTEYAAKFLKNLRRRTGSWAHAVGRYHSSNWQGRGRHYWRKVRILWKKERVRDYKLRRAKDIDAYKKRKQLAERYDR
tara:strand:- start:6875 stop:7573 length:699 start_codon:yes stop_codon:yes gene_type:complete